MTIEQISINSGAVDENLSSLRFNRRRYLSHKRSLVSANGQEIRLRAKTQQVFELLASNANSVVTREQLATSVWNDVIVGDDTLNQSIREIRKAIGDSDRKILETLPRQGFLLHAEEVPSDLKTGSESLWKNRSTIPLLGAAAVLFVLGIIYFLQTSRTEPANTIVASHSGNHSGNNSHAPENSRYSAREGLRLSVEIVGGTTKFSDRLVRSVVSELSRYSNIEPTEFNSVQSDYILELSQLADDDSLFNLQLRHVDSTQLVLAENLEIANTDTSSIPLLAGRIAALIGSPAGGAIGNHLMKISRSKPVGALTRPECLAHGYGCTSCSGDADSVTPRAVQCLAKILERDPEDPDAWALQSTIYSRQYLWGSALQEPMRTDKSKRSHLKVKAVEAASRAEELAGGSNPSVYWGMAQAYLASCQSDKMRVAVERGIKLNPHDPNILAVYGNFMSFTGEWDYGKELVDQARAQETRFFKQWWYMAPAKWHYRRGEYQKAYDLFIKSFNERNWLSHLQLAYTLPHLGRIEEAKKALEQFMRVAPSMTREHVYEFYRSYCFDDDFLNRIKVAFDLIDMPSRGSGDDLKKIKPVHATVEMVGDREVEYVDVGKGTPVVFVHGSFSDYRTWGYMLLPVSERQRFIAYTLRYFGTLDWPAGEPQFDEKVDTQDLIDFIEHKEIGPVYLVGWSRSGSIVGEVARLRPDLVRGMIIYEPVLNELIDPKSNPNPPDPVDLPDFSKVADYVQQQELESAVSVFFEQALERQPGEFQTEPIMLQRVVLDNARTLPLNFSAHNELFVDCDFLSTIEVPGLVLYGENTNSPWQFMSKRYAECLDNGQSKTVTGATHDGPLSQPQKVADYIDEFILSTQFKN